MTGGQPPPWYLNPYAQITACALLVTGAEVLLKIGAVESAQEAHTSGIFAFGALTSLATWGGIALLAASFGSWLYVLRLMPITQAYALINLVHVLVPAAAWLFLHEAVSQTRWAGIALVLLGTILVAAPVAKAEQDL